MQAFTKCVQVVGICRDSALRSRCPLLVVVGGIDHQAEEGCKWHACGTVKHSDTAFLEQCDITRDFWKITIGWQQQSCRGLALIQDAPNT